MEDTGDELLEQQARYAAILGVIGLTALSVWNCTYGATLPVALGCGLAGVWFARPVLAAEVSGEARAYANVGLYTGGIAVAFGAVFLCFCGSMIGLYGLMFGGMFLAS